MHVLITAYTTSKSRKLVSPK